MNRARNRIRKTLVLGYGNPARGDDGLGPKLITLLEQADLEMVEARVGYQLCVEDAMDIGHYRQVIFVDASKSAKEPFECQPLVTDIPPNTLDTHSVSPQALMHLARSLFGSTTPARVMAIRGYQFEAFVESISTRAEENLDQAFHHILKLLSLSSNEE